MERPELDMFSHGSRSSGVRLEVNDYKYKETDYCACETVLLRSGEHEMRYTYYLWETTIPKKK